MERGIFLSTMGGGLLLGGIIAKVLGHKFPKGLLMIYCAIIGGFCMIGISFTSNPILAGICLTGTGIFGGTMSTLIPASIQSASKEESRGRVMSIYTLVFQMTPALSGFTLSQVSDKIGISQTLLVAGVIVTLMSFVSMILFKNIRQYK